MYVLKLKKKNSIDPSYASENFIQQVKEIRDEDSNFHLSHFFLTLKTAKKLMFELIMRNNAVANDWYGDEDKLEYIAIVELSNYEPYAEYQVIDYREFK